jgi:NAD-dependent deacetylase
MHDLLDLLRRDGPRFRRIAVLTGAGISAESGIPTFRGADGFWRDYDPQWLFSSEALAAEPALIWSFYDELRTRIARTAPNAGHRALAALAGMRAVTVATQNIDGLHQRAGSVDVVELHGTLWMLRCPACAFRAANDTAPLPHVPPRCPGCDGILRPDVVLYGETLPEDAWQAAAAAMTACDLLLVVGTSGVVYPANALPSLAARAGAVVAEINPDETALTPTVHAVLRATAADALPRVLGVLSAES